MESAPTVKTSKSPPKSVGVGAFDNPFFLKQSRQKPSLATRFSHRIGRAGACSRRLCFMEFGPSGVSLRLGRAHVPATRCVAFHDARVATLRRSLQPKYRSAHQIGRGWRPRHPVFSNTISPKAFSGGRLVLQATVEFALKTQRMRCCLACVTDYSSTASGPPSLAREGL